MSNESEVIDVSKHCEPGDMPCCPLCDNGIEEYSLAALAFAHGYKCLVHTHCLEGLDP